MKTSWCLLKLSLLFISLWVCPRTANAFYDPGIQRWVNRDPLGDAGTSARFQQQNAPDGYSNLFKFAQNHPQNASDAFGLRCYELVMCCVGKPFTVVCISLIRVGDCPPQPLTETHEVTKTTYCLFLLNLCVQFPIAY